MAPRYQALHAATMSRAAPAFSSAAVMGPATTVEGLRVWCGGCSQPVELGRPAGQVVPGHQRGDPAVTELGGDPGGVRAQRGDPDGQVGGGRLAQAKRARGPGGAELGGLAGQQRTDLGHDVAQLGGWVLERGVVEPLGQRLGAGAQAQQGRAGIR